MNDISNLSDTIIAKSDRLNAEDLLAGPITVTVTNVYRKSADSPIAINYDGDNGRPFEPCKTMRKVLVAAWGEDGNKWVGCSMTLFNDESVKWAGKEQGGVRISHMSHIAKRININLTATRGKKQAYVINILQANYYPDDKFANDFVKMSAAFNAGKLTIGQIISKCNKTGALTPGQLAQVEGLESKPIDHGFNPALPVEQSPQIDDNQQPEVTQEQVTENF
jgi:hypothetical protein